MRRQITDSSNKKAFTLLELLIVVLIIGIAYSIVIAKFNNPTKEVGTLLTLKDDLAKIKKDAYGDTLDLVCKGENCESCAIYIENKQTEKKPEIFTEMPKVHQFDENGYMEEKQYGKDICFVYQLFPNGSGSSMLLEYKKEYYVFYPTVEKTKSFTYYEDALKEFDPKNFIPTGTNEYYGD